MIARDSLAEAQTNFLCKVDLIKYEKVKGCAHSTSYFNA